MPIACSLTVDEVPDRLAQIAALGEAALQSAEVQGARAVLRFRARPGTREQLEALVAAEAKCCAFLQMDLGDAPGAVVLTIRSEPGGEPVLADLVGAFRGGHAAL